MEVQVDSQPLTGNILGVTLHGEIDMATASRLKQNLYALLEQNPRVVLDLQDVQYLDSSGLAVLLGALRQARERGGSLALVCTNTHILKLFSLTGLDTAVPIFATDREAAAHLEEAAPSA
jgi:anti-sigma B factor antagonist